MSFFGKKTDPYKERYERIERMKKAKVLYDAELGIIDEEQKLERELTAKRARIEAAKPKTGFLSNVGRGIERASEGLEKFNKGFGKVQGSKTVRGAQRISQNYERAMFDSPIGKKRKGKTTTLKDLL